jgi:hypothetical protein
MVPALRWVPGAHNGPGMPVSASSVHSRVGSGSGSASPSRQHGHEV